MGASPIDSSRAEFSGQKLNSPLFELACVLVRLNHIASFIVNANHSVVAAGPRKFSISSPVDEMSR